MADQSVAKNRWEMVLLRGRGRPDGQHNVRHEAGGHPSHQGQGAVSPRIGQGSAGGFWPGTRLGRARCFGPGALAAFILGTFGLLRSAFGPSKCQRKDVLPEAGFDIANALLTATRDGLPTSAAASGCGIAGARAQSINESRPSAGRSRPKNPQLSNETSHQLRSGSAKSRRPSSIFSGISQVLSPTLRFRRLSPSGNWRNTKARGG